MQSDLTAVLARLSVKVGASQHLSLEEQALLFAVAKAAAELRDCEMATKRVTGEDRLAAWQAFDAALSALAQRGFE